MPVAKVFFYLGSSQQFFPNSRLGQKTSFVGILGLAHEGGLFYHAPLDAATQLHLLRAAGGSERFVIQVEPDRDWRVLRAYLEQRGLEYRLKRASRQLHGWRHWLATGEREAHNVRVIFHAQSDADLRWTLGRYGSLNQMQAFAVREEALADFDIHLERSSQGVVDPMLLDQCTFLALFDDDWDYIFLVARGLSGSGLVSRLRRACQSMGLDAETATGVKELANIHARIQRLIAASSRNAMAAERAQAA